jgi:N-acetyltransferase
MTAGAGPPLGLVTLRGAHVELVPLTAEHVDALLPVALDPEIWKFTVESVASREELEGFVGRALAARDAGTALPFATVERGTGRVVGSTRFANYERAHSRIEIGWTWIGREWQRTAVNTEAKLLMLGHAFEALGLRRVELKTDVLNERSRTAILRLGAVEEGILRQHTVTARGRVRDTVYFSILASEWPDVKARLSARLAAHFT